MYQMRYSERDSIMKALNQAQGYIGDLRWHGANTFDDTVISTLSVLYDALFKLMATMAEEDDYLR